MGARKLLILTFSLFSFFTLSLTAQAFTDVPAGHQYAEAINYLKEQGVVQGYDDGSYRPEQTISRAEFLKILLLMQSTHRSLMEKSEDKGGCFEDVELDSWYQQYVCYAHSAKIVNGDGNDGLFHPGRNVNFVEAAKILGGSGYFYAISSDGFEWYVHYVSALSGKYVIPTDIDTLDHQVTRGEMAEMIWRLRENVDYLDSTQFTFGAQLTVSEHNQYYKIIDGKVYYHGYALALIEGADADTFEPIGDGHSRDEQFVYYEHNRIDVDDPDSFRRYEKCRDGTEYRYCLFYRDEENLYYALVKIEDVNPDSFSFIGSSNYYWTDGEQVYYQNFWSGSNERFVFADADPDNVEVGDNLLYDFANNRVYYYQRLVEGAQADSFGYFIDGETNYYSLYKDADHIYYYDCTDGNGCNLYLLEGADAASFEVVAGDVDEAVSDAGSLFRDDDQYFYVSEYGKGIFKLAPFEFGDYDSFERLESGMYRDQDHLYVTPGYLSRYSNFFDEVLTFDIGENFTFERVNDNYFVVDGEVYFAGDLMEGVSAENLMSFSYSEDLYAALVQDEQSLYFAGKKVEGVDMESIKIENSLCVSDENYFYYLNYDDFAKIDDNEQLILEKVEKEGNTCWDLVYDY